MHSIVTDKKKYLPHAVMRKHGEDIICMARFLYIRDAEFFKDVLTQELKKWQDSQEVAEATDVPADKTDASQSADA